MSTTRLLNYGEDTWDWTVTAVYRDTEKPYQYWANTSFYYSAIPWVVMGPATITGPDSSMQWAEIASGNLERKWQDQGPETRVLPTGTVTMRGSLTIQPGYAAAKGNWAVLAYINTTGNGAYRYGNTSYTATFHNTRTGQIVRFDSDEGELQNTNTSVGLEVEYADKIELVPGGKTVLARYKPMNASGTGYRVHVNASKDVASMIVVVDAAGNRVRWNDTVTATTEATWSVEALQGAPNGVVQGEITIDVSLV
ncbi:hypothetical protein QUQ76_005011 [Escherichia coli]|nr:hypothetical protein [Escherichia coli]